jgi:hypothetical protein
MNNTELMIKEARTLLWERTGRIIDIDLLRELVLDGFPNLTRS